MNVFEEKVFIGQRVRLDYSRWANCIFKECEIVIWTGMFELNGCEFTDCKLTLKGEAQNIARLMYVFFPDKIPLKFPEGDPGPLAVQETDKEAT